MFCCLTASFALDEDSTAFSPFFFWLLNYRFTVPSTTFLLFSCAHFHMLMLLPIIILIIASISTSWFSLFFFFFYWLKVVSFAGAADSITIARKTFIFITITIIIIIVVVVVVVVVVFPSVKLCALPFLVLSCDTTCDSSNINNNNKNSK